MRCILYQGIKADYKRIRFSKILFDDGDSSSSKHVYDNAAKIAKSAHKKGTTLKEEVLKTNLISEKEYDKIMDPIKMTKPK